MRVVVGGVGVEAAQQFLFGHAGAGEGPTTLALDALDDVADLQPGVWSLGDVLDDGPQRLVPFDAGEGQDHRPQPDVVGRDGATVGARDHPQDLGGLLGGHGSPPSPRTSASAAST